ncbi:MAG: TIGR01777 family oxidoreductase [Bdellovibrionota bacterium]
MKVLVTGASGFVGRRVVSQLLQKKIEVVVLTRNLAKAVIVLGSECQYVQWMDMTTPPPAEAFDNVDAVINLMGENIGGKKWDEAQKKKIYDSRINSTRALVDAMKALPKKPKALINASAVGIYGNRGDETLDENATSGSDYLAGVCKDWEAEAIKARDMKIRVVLMRTGVVLGKGGGALTKMLPIFKLGLGGRLGTGKQYMSWIHVDDLAAMYVQAAIDSTMDGAYNATSPYPATNAEFTKALGKRLKRPTIFPAPEFAIKKALGEMSTIVLDGQKVVPNKFKEKKFQFKSATLEKTLKETAW